MLHQYPNSVENKHSLFQILFIYVLIGASQVEDFGSRPVNTTSVILYWTAPSIIPHLAVKYNLRCNPIIIKVPSHEMVVPANLTAAVITDLHPGTSYNCSIFITVNLQGMSEPQSIITTTPEAGRY